MEPNTKTYASKQGVWSWDEIGNGLIYITRDMHQKTPSLTNTNITAITVGSGKQSGGHDVKFRETVDVLEQVGIERIRFRRYCQRRCKTTEPEVVTIQDIKDVVLYTANPKTLTTEFINYFHLPTMDRFLRALIVYFQHYLQFVTVWENMMERREEEKRKLRQPYVTVLENIVRDDLADLRSMVAREYCSILVGAADAKKFHHMNNTNNDSLSDKDRRLFETLIVIAVRVVWVALQRKFLSLIELELNRLLRTEVFNIIIHHGGRGGNAFAKTPAEDRIMLGTAQKEERKLLQRSPAARELLFADHDHRLLAAGFLECEPKDERIEYLEAAFAAPEEKLIDLGVTVGILGLPRNDLDAMLQCKERVAKKSKIPKELPGFKIPKVVPHKDEAMQKTFPQKPCKFTETAQTIRARKSQARMWRKFVRRSAEFYDSSVLDLTVCSLSRTAIFSSKVSLLTDLD